jgi:tRNA threonylcarbamoyladenosine biosynthesis protein TsaE
MISLFASSEAEQERLGVELARLCPRRCVIYLEGELGTGKTTLARGFLRGLGHRGVVKSPTYTLIEPYEVEERLCYHLDLYRLADPAELEYIGIRDLLREPAVLLVEWPERGRGALPEPDLRIQVEHSPPGRRLSVLGESEQGRALEAALAEHVPANPELL